MSVRWNRLYRGTPAELALEDAVAALGIPYRTQFPGFLYGFRFFPDFLLPTLKVVLEVDDASHNRIEKALADDERTDYLETEQGWKVARCTNEEALANPGAAVRMMLASVGKWPLPSSLPRIADSLPTPKKCPPKDRRAAREKARLAKRKRLRRSDSPRLNPVRNEVI